MPTTPRTGFPYPSFRKDPWFDDFSSMVVAIDSSLYAGREDRGIVLMGGGTFTFTAGTGVLTWDANIEASAVITGFLWAIAAGNVTLEDGEFLYANVARAPVGNQTLTLATANTVPSSDEALLFAVRRGSRVYWRNGASIGDGDTATIFMATPGAGLVASTLATVLAAGNITGGSNIRVGVGDEIVAQASQLSLRAPDAPSLSGSPGDDVWLTAGAGDALGSSVGGNILVTPGAGTGGSQDGNLYIDGRMILTEQPSPQPAAGTAGIFVSDGSGGRAQNMPYWVNQDNKHYNLTQAVWSTEHVGGYTVVDGVTLLAVAAQFAFDPNTWDGGFGGLVFQFEVILSVNDLSRTATTYLYNLTDSEVVTGTTLTAVGLTTPTKRNSGNLTVGLAAGNLKAGEKVYEVRLENDGTLVSELSVLGGAKMIIKQA